VNWKCRPAQEAEDRWLSLEARDGRIVIGETEPYDGAGRRRDQLRDEVLDAVTGIAQSRARIARAVGRESNDGTVGRVLKDLEGEGLVVKRNDGWARKIGGAA
jgi:hypothetical protein